MTWQYLIKALYAGIVAALGSFIGIAEATGGSVSAVSWAIIALAFITAFGGILGWQAAPATVATSTRQP